MILDSLIEPKALFMMKAGIEAFLCRIRETDDNSITVSVPGQDYPVSGQEVLMEFHDEVGWYQFQARVVKGPEMNSPTAILSRPLASERIMYRAFTRVPTDIKCSFSDETDAAKKEGLISNISLGGIQLLTDEECEPETKLEIDFELPLGTFRNAVAVICYGADSRLEAAEYAYGCKFADLQDDLAATVLELVRSAAVSQ
ncbi:flagellar brake protein [Candidatus Hydrogenedentota bacterium]